MSAEKLMPLVTPGEILNEEFLKPLGISGYRLSKDTGIPASRIHEIVRGRRAITADTAFRLGMYFGMEPEFWMNLQTRYELLKIQRAHTTGHIKRCPLVPAA